MSAPKQCKDIDTDAILRFLAEHQGEWCMWFSQAICGDRSIMIAMPPDTSEKLALAKMRMLMRSKLVHGCGCGCRGDFEITDKGLARIGKSRTKRMIG